MTLLPCPFCGGEAMTALWDGEAIEVSCASAGKNVDCAGGDVRASITAWNTRAPSAEWQGIETAPRDGTQLLLIGQYPTASSNGGQWSDIYHGWAQAPHGEGWAVHWARWPHSFGPTHWMPLPSPPLSAHDTSNENDRGREEPSLPTPPRPAEGGES